MGNLFIVLGISAFISAGEPATGPHGSGHHIHRAHHFVKGILHTDIIAMGGETTGIALDTAKGSVELIVPSDLQTALSSFNGKAVSLTGKHTVLHGVETGDRKAIEVANIILDVKKPTVIGKLTLGENPTLEMKNNKVELVLDRHADNKQYKDLDGKEVKVVGLWTKNQSHERALVVESISEAIK